MNIKVKKMNDDAQLPFRATDGSAGSDLFACINSDVILKSGERLLIPTGLAIELNDKNFGAFIFPRSSVSYKSGVSLANCVGVIDSDYRGEIKVPLINHSDSDFAVHNGDRIAQMIIMPVVMPVFEETDVINETNRGSGGFG